MVTMRSESPMKLDTTLSRVVFPEPVPPEMSTLSLEPITAWSRSTISGVREPSSIRSSAFSGSAGKRRIESMGPSRARGGMMALTRDPSDRRASTMGLSSSTRRPTLETIFSMMRIRWLSSLKRATVRSSRPWRST